MKALLRLAVFGVLALAACERREAVPIPQTTTPPPTTAQPVLEAPPSLASLNRGGRLFQEHCAQCHGPEAQGHPDWQTPGVIAAPPLDGTGNAWKRTRAELYAVIAYGAARGGTPVMPAWKDRLSESEINDLIAWFQALWPPEVYGQWQARNAAAAR